MNILHATTDPKLLTRFKEMLASSARADIAVGYFFMSGFEAVADDLSNLLKVRILVGRTDQRVLEEVAAGLQQAPALRARLDTDSLVQRRQRAGLAQQAVHHIRDGISTLPQEEGTEAAVQTLRNLVAEGKVEVRTYLRSPLHAKAYLCWYDNHAEPGAAVVGSSNLTLAGFEGNTELNVRVSGDAEMAALKTWFDDLWAESEDISEALVTELDRSWALDDTPPYYVYLKALHELYASEIGGGDLPLPVGREPLANFQIDAVKRGLGMIEEHGGCYIGDVVGLGKTFIGAELLRQLRVSYPNDGPPLILCPAGLKPMWEQFNERFGLGAAVVSQSLITAVPSPEFDEELGRYVDAEPPEHGIILEQEYPNRGSVLVDDAHNFRNINQRSRGLRDYLDAGDHKVILLSATPQNLGPMDIYRQLRLFLDNTEHGLNIEPVNLEEYFTNARLWLEYRVDDENYRADFEEWKRNGQKGSPPVPGKSKPTVPHAQIEEVLSSRLHSPAPQGHQGPVRRHGRGRGEASALPGPCAGQRRLSAGQGVRQSRLSQGLGARARPAQGPPVPGHGLHQGGGQGEGGVPRPLPGSRPHREADGRAALQAAGVEHRGVPLDPDLAPTEQPQLPRGA